MKSLRTCMWLLLLLFAESNSQSSVTSASQTFLLSDDTSIYMPATTSYYENSELYGSGDDSESYTTSATSFSVEPSSTVMTSSYSTSTIFPSETTMTFSSSDTGSTSLTPTSQFTPFSTSSPIDSTSTQFTQSFSSSTRSFSSSTQSFLSSTQSFSSSTQSSSSTTQSSSSSRAMSASETGRQMNVAITLRSPRAGQRGAFAADILTGLLQYYRRQMGAESHLESLVIGTINYWNRTNTDGQISNIVTVNYTVVLDNTDEATGEFAEAHAELATSEHFVALGVQQTVIETTILGETYYRDSRSGVTGLRDISCNIYEQSINGCPSDKHCVVEDDKARCVRRVETVSDEDWSLKVGLGVGIPLFALLCGLTCCCCCYICLARRRRRRPVERDDESSVKSVFVLRMIPTRFYTVGRSWPLFGSYIAETRPSPSVAWPSHETWSVTDSDVSVEDFDEREEDSTHHVRIGFQPFQKELRSST